VIPITMPIVCPETDRHIKIYELTGMYENKQLQINSFELKIKQANKVITKTFLLSLQCDIF